jgi:Peptidase family M23
MNVFRLTKRSIVSNSSYSKSKKKKKSSLSEHFFTPFFSKKGHSFNDFFKTSSRIYSSWREDWKPWLISFWIALRAKISPTFWLIRDTIGILTTHVKATILPFLWRVRYEIGLLSTHLQPFLNHIRLKIIDFLVQLQMRLSPILKPINREIGKLKTNTVQALAPVLAPIHYRIGVITSHTQVALMPVLAPVNNKLAIYTPSVKKLFKHKKEVFFSLFLAFWQLIRRQSLATNFIGLSVIVICSLAYVKRKENVLQQQVKYGFSYKDYHVNESEMEKGDAVYSMLIKLGLTYRQTDSLLAVVKPSYDFEKIQIGKPYTTLISKGLQNSTSYFIIEPDPKRYFVFDLATPSVKEVKRVVSVTEFQKGGMIRETLYKALVENGTSQSLIDMVQEALENKIDIKQCTDGEEYKLIWEEELIEGQSVGTEKLTCVYFRGLNQPEPIHIFYYNNGLASGWYDKEGLPTRGGFLGEPVLNSTITSRFSWRRKHPILGYRRPHLGTDYAAPRGTPIMSVADGVVEEAKYRLGNGRYVKIKHNPPYETEYLHMSRFAEGIEKGSWVNKKQIIGYIGMSGLTTGPHVCFRLWKNGKAIDPLTERYFTEADNVQFKKMVSEKMVQLDKIPMLNYSY